MPVVAVIPVKSFRLGKRRLGEALDDESRTRLGRALAERTTAMAIAVDLIAVVVAGDAEVAEWATRSGVPSLPDPGTGLDDAAVAGVDWALASGSAWLVVHADLPLLSPADLSLLAGSLPPGGVIAPSADGGTSAIGGTGALRPGYGPGSFHRHLARYPNATVVATPGLLHDVDSPLDLASVRAHPRGAWLRTVL